MKTDGNNSTTANIRLLVVSITGTSKLQDAIRIQNSWRQFLGPHDVVRIICDVGCKSHNNNQSIVELDPDLVNSIQRPRHFEKNPKNLWEYRLAQIKFYFGLISQMRQFDNVPQWILIKDDDAYVHADHLMQLVEGVDFAKEKVSLVGGWAGRRVELLYPPGTSDNGPPEGCFWPDGGPGLLLSQAMALELVRREEQLFSFMRQKLEKSEWAFHWDIWIPVIASWGGGRLYHSPAMRHLYLKHKEVCFDRKANATPFVSIHMKEIIKKYGIEIALAQLEDCMQQTFVPPTELLRDRIAQTRQENSSVKYCP